MQKMPNTYKTQMEGKFSNRLPSTPIPSDTEKCMQDNKKFLIKNNLNKNENVTEAKKALRKVTLRKISLNDNQEPLFTKTIYYEELCFDRIRLYGKSLHPQTLQALVYVFGRSLTYLLSYGSRSYPQWLESAVNNIVAQVFEIDQQIKDTGAEEYFTKSLKVSVVCDENGNLAKELQEQLQKKQRQIKVSEVGDTIGKVIQGGFLGASVIGMALGGPITWGMLLPVLANTAYVKVNDHFKKSQREDFNKFFEIVFHKLECDLKIVLASVEDEFKYNELRRVQIARFRTAELKLQEFLRGDYLKLCVSKERSEEENEFLELMELSINKNTQQQTSLILNLKDRLLKLDPGLSIDDFQGDENLLLEYLADKEEEKIKAENTSSFKAKNQFTDSNNNIVKTSFSKNTTFWSNVSLNKQEIGNEVIEESTEGKITLGKI